MPSIEETVIKFVKKNELFYVPSHPLYHDRRAKDRKWMELGEKLGLDWKGLKSLWKYLKISYFRYLRTEETVTGQGQQVLDPIPNDEPEILEQGNQLDSLDHYGTALAEALKKLPPNVRKDAKEHISDYINNLERD